MASLAAKADPEQHDFDAADPRPSPTRETAPDGRIPLSVEDAPRTAASATASPARAMQEVLGREFAQYEEGEAPWSLRRTVAFIVLTCGAFWTAVYFAIAALLS